MSFSPVLDSALITAVAFTFRDERRVHAAKDRSYDSIVNEILNGNLIFYLLPAFCIYPRMVR